MTATVNVFLKDGVLDPQGKAAHHAHFYYVSMKFQTTKPKFKMSLEIRRSGDHTRFSMASALNLILTTNIFIVKVYD